MNPRGNSDRRTGDARRATCSLAEVEKGGKVGRVWSWNLSLKELLASQAVKTLLYGGLLLVAFGWGANAAFDKAIARYGAPHEEKSAMEHKRIDDRVTRVDDRITVVDQKAQARREAVEKRLDADELLLKDAITAARDRDEEYRKILDAIRGLERQMARLNALHERPSNLSSEQRVKPLTVS